MILYDISYCTAVVLQSSAVPQVFEGLVQAVFGDSVEKLVALAEPTLLFFFGDGAHEVDGAVREVEQTVDVGEEPRREAVDAGRLVVRVDSLAESIKSLATLGEVDGDGSTELVRFRDVDMILFRRRAAFFRRSLPFRWRDPK